LPECDALYTSVPPPSLESRTAVNDADLASGEDMVLGLTGFALSSEWSLRARRRRRTDRMKDRQTPLLTPEPTQTQLKSRRAAVSCRYPRCGILSVAGTGGAETSPSDSGLAGGPPTRRSNEPAQAQHAFVRLHCCSVPSWLGCVERQNVAIEYCFAENRRDQLPGSAADPIEGRVAVVVDNLAAERSWEVP
jgi:hypothetical protein